MEELIGNIRYSTISFHFLLNGHIVIGQQHSHIGFQYIQSVLACMKLVLRDTLKLERGANIHHLLLQFFLGRMINGFEKFLKIGREAETSIGKFSAPG